MDGEVYHRTPYQATADTLSPVDLAEPEDTEEEEEDDEEEEEMEEEMEEDHIEEPLSSTELARRMRRLVDPGPFKHNRKVVLAALPCFLIILAICGEP